MIKAHAVKEKSSGNGDHSQEDETSLDVEVSLNFFHTYLDELGTGKLGCVQCSQFLVIIWSVLSKMFAYKEFLFLVVLMLFIVFTDGKMLCAGGLFCILLLGKSCAM